MAPTVLAPAVVDPGLQAAADVALAKLNDNLPAILLVTGGFVGASILLGMVRGLRKNRV